MNRLLVLCLTLLMGTCAIADPNAVLQPGAAVNARTSEQLSAEWWQWAMSADDEISPIRDSTGANCSVGQKGAVWFLAGGFGSSKIRRTCTVLAGRSLFFPIINMVYMPARGYKTLTCEQARAAAALNNDTAIDLFAELDGVPIPDLRRYRVATQQCFDAYARIPEFKRSINGFPSASDGYWLLLQPLAKGKHLLKFGGRYNRSSEDFGRMVQDIEYELLVQ
jgi:hypothetical protein